MEDWEKPLREVETEQGLEDRKEFNLVEGASEGQGRVQEST